MIPFMILQISLIVDVITIVQYNCALVIVQSR